MLDTLILWRNERDQPRGAAECGLAVDFALRSQSLDVIERRDTRARRAPFGIGQIAIVCALGYLDFRFADLAWRDGRGRSAAWFESSRSGRR